jgi:hypothetical protein
MSDLNIKIVCSPDAKPDEQKSSSYLLNVKVLDDLKQAIKQAKDASSTRSEHTQE